MVGQAWSRRWRELLAIDGLWIGLLVATGLWVLAPEPLFLRGEVTVGEVASRDYVAPRDDLLPDEETTRQKQLRAQEAVLPVYDFDQSAATVQDVQMLRLFAAGRLFLEDLAEVVGADQLPIAEVEEGLLSALTAGSAVRITTEQARLFRERGFESGLEDRVRGLMSVVLRTGVVANKALLLENRMRGVSLRNLETDVEQTQLDLYGYRGHPEDVESFFDAEVARWSGWSRSQRALLAEFLVDNTSPNMAFSLSETTLRRESAAGDVEPVYSQILKGQAIARKGDTISPADARAINVVMGASVASSWWRPARWLPWFGNLLLLCLVCLALRHGLKRTRLAEGHLDERTLGGLLLLLVLSVVAVKLGLFVGGALADSFVSEPLNSLRSYRLAIPYATLALVTSLFYGRGAALLVALCFAVLVGRLVGDGSMATSVVVLGTSLAAIYALDGLKQRSAVTRAGVLVGLAGMAIALMLATFEEGIETLGSVVGFDLICALIGGLLVAAATSFVVPVLESVLGLTTDIKLLELSDTNLPLLQRLAFEAPGTFQHSLMVSNLAKAGCEKIGANAVLAYTGGLYHDVGKVLRPAYFVENQRDGDNRHDRLAPSMSSLIVINHVKEGAELARAHGLPKPIVDAIQQHHGTRQLEFFLKRAQELAKGRKVDEHKYRYPGPKPQNKVMGVLMFADIVEAASRTLRDPSPTAIRNLVKRLLNECVNDDQLDETDLTLADLSRVSEAFIRVLETIHHKRVEYPGYDFNRKLRAVEGH